MALKDSPFIALAQQGAEAANQVITEQSVGNHQGEPSGGN
jgi:hypothetical protein